MDFRPGPGVWTGNFEALLFSDPESLRFSASMCCAVQTGCGVRGWAGLGLEGGEQVTRRSCRRCPHLIWFLLQGGPRVGRSFPVFTLVPTPAWATGYKMNCRSEVLEVSVEGRQVEEAMLAVLHTVLLHRSTGKFHYKKEGTYSIGTVGTQDVDCDFIDFTYVRVSSEELDRALRKVVGEFRVRWGAVGGRRPLSVVPTPPRPAAGPARPSWGYLSGPFRF